MRHSIPSPNGHQTTKGPNFFIEWSIRNKPDYSTEIYGFWSNHYDIWRKPTLLLMEKAYCFLAAAALFAIFELQHIGMTKLLFAEKAYCQFTLSTLFNIFNQLQKNYSLKVLKDICVFHYSTGAKTWTLKVYVKPEHFPLTYRAMLHFSNEISRADQVFEGSFLITAPPIVNLWFLKQPLTFLLPLASLVFLSTTWMRLSQ